ncbi:MAG: FMN-binding negative transcriptional regulator, partial [Ignavibacteriales bacterium]|nr:FMN-binding negative transcriptional regulator [Ignavibacteriales bacterium]
MPKLYENFDLKALEQFIRSNPFGMIISQSNGSMAAT